MKLPPNIPVASVEPPIEKKQNVYVEIFPSPGSRKHPSKKDLYQIYTK